MSDLKKRQHYVWRHYLMPWSENETIWTYFKELDKIAQPGLMGVVQEKYFYGLVDFTNDELAFLEKFIDRTSPEVLKPLNFDFLALFTSTTILKKKLAENTNPKVNRELVASEIKKLEANAMEDAHCIMENFGSRLLQCRSFEELKRLDEGDNLLEAIMFLCVQYFRTKNMRKSALKSFSGGQFEQLMDKAWNIISFVLATTLAKSISLDQRLKFAFIENTTAIPFATGDQPVFNILNDILDDEGDVTELELYYPLTPKFALTVHFRPEQAGLFENRIAGDEEVNYLNRKVFANSDFYVFCNNNLTLEMLKQNT